MSAGSGASNLGYSNVNPYNMSPSINGTSSNYSGSFSSNEIPGQNGLPGLYGTKSNIDAAASRAPGICLQKGGAKIIKRKIKNITKQYKKMRKGSKKMKSLKTRIRSRMASRNLSRSFLGGKTRRHRKRHSRRQRGGYAQYNNNYPSTPSYSLGGILPANELGLANPPPYKVLPAEVDNYNHYTGTGFPSRGH